MIGKVKSDPADRLFSQWIRLRDRECMRCHSPVRFNAQGMPVSHQNSHFIGRRKEATRFEKLNCDTLCGACHLFFTAHPAEHYAWQVERKGQEVVDQLVLQANTYKKKDRTAERLYWTQELRNI